MSDCNCYQTILPRFTLWSHLKILKKVRGHNTTLTETTSAELDRLIVFLDNNKGPDATLSATIV